MATERIDIIVAENGSRTVRRNLQDVGSAGKEAAGAVDLLKRALIGLGTVATLRFLQQQADTYTNILNRLRLVTSSTENLTRVNNELFASANRTRSEYESTVDLYSNLARSSKTLGLSQKELLGITETVNQAITISGTEASTAANGLRQLGQGLASGTLRGDELNSVLENMPRLAQAIADGMGVTVGQLRNLGAQGKITAAQITDALLKEAPKIAEEFARVNPTLAGSFVVLRNNVAKMIGDFDQAIGDFDQATGVSTTLANALLALSQHLDVVAVLAAGIVAAFAWQGIVSAVGGVLGPIIALNKALGAGSTLSALFAAATKLAQGAVNGLTASLLANPFTALIVVVTAAVAAIVAFGDQVSVTADGAVTLKDAFFAALSLIGDLFGTVIDTAMAVWDAGVQFISGLLEGFGTSFSEVMSFVLSIAKAVVNGYIGVWKLAFDTVKLIWNNFPGFMDALFVTVANAAAAAAEFVLNAWQAPLRAIQVGLSYVNQDAANGLGGALNALTITIPRAKASAAGRQFADDFGTAAREDLTRNYLGELGDAIVARARQRKAAEGQRKAAEGAAGTLDPGGNATATPGAAGKKSKGETRAEYLARISSETENATRLARSMDFEYAKVDADINSIDEHLADKKWAELSLGERTAIREKLKAMYDEQDAQERARQLYDQFKKPQEDYVKGQEAINRVVAAFPQYADEGARALRDLRIEYLRTKTDLASGLELGRLQTQKDQANVGGRAAGFYQEEYGAANNALRDLQERATVLQQLLKDDPINSGQYRQRMQELGIQALQLKAQLPGADTFDALRAGFASFVADFKGVIPGLSSAWGNFFSSFADGAANSIGRAIVYGDNLASSLKSVAQEALATLIGALVKLGIQWLVMQVIGQTAMAAVTATGAVAGAATAAAWAPAAAAVSLATFGANAGPAIAGIGATYALTSALSAVGGVLGLADGGRVAGPGGPRDDKVLARLSNGEFVMNADATRRFLPVLEAMNYGRLPAFATGGAVGSVSSALPVPQVQSSDAGGSRGVKVTIEDHVGAKFEVQQVSRDEVRVIARQEAQDQIRRMTPDVVAADIRNPNGKTSKALAGSTKTQRRR